MRARNGPGGLTDFGREVKRRLIDAGMTQEELAGQLGCSAVYLCRILHGARSGRKYAGHICYILGIEGGDADG